MGQNFSFGNVQGPVQTGDGVQYTAGRDQYLAGGDQNIALGSAEEAWARLDDLRRGVARLSLGPDERARADHAVDDLDDALHSPGAERSAIAACLERSTAELERAGALVSAAGPVVTAITALAHWLGPAGAAVLALL